MNHSVAFPTCVRRASVLALLSIALAFSGCTDSTSGKLPISGSVTFRGEPVNEGTVVLEPSNNDMPQAVGGIVDGKYTIHARDGVRPGTYSVRVVAYRKTGKTYVTSEVAGSEVEPVIEQYIPRKYNAQSELKLTIKEDESNYPLVLE